MTINKFSNNTPDKPFHSHTFAEAASGSSMGSTSAQSFGQRYQIDKNRRVVGRYTESFIASTGERLKDELNRRMDAPADGGDTHGKRKYHPTRQGFNAGATPTAGPGTAGAKPLQVPKRSFSEPPKRGYNPFS